MPLSGVWVLLNVVSAMQYSREVGWGCVIYQHKTDSAMAVWSHQGGLVGHLALCGSNKGEGWAGLSSVCPLGRVRVLEWHYGCEGREEPDKNVTEAALKSGPL